MEVGSGSIWAFGPCTVCGKMHSFHPERVPSFDGEPICRDCIILINQDREKLGKTPAVIYPNSYGPDN